MTLLFWAAVFLLVCGFAAMNPWTIGMALVLGAFAIHKIDQRQMAANRENQRRLDQEQMAKGNGHPKGNVDLIVRSHDGR